jgi:hypothetical protein
MIREFREDDGMDPGLGDLAYDGAEYETDEFGERIGSDDLFDDEATEEDEITPGAATPEEVRVEDGFGETINQDKNPNLEQQVKDDSLGREARADFGNASEQAMPAVEDERPED